MDFAAISVDEVAAKFISASPPGQLNNMVDNLATLAPSIVTPDFIDAAAQKYNQDHLRIVTSSDGVKLIVSTSSALGGKHYLEPHRNEVYAVDQVTLECSATNISSSPPRDSQEEYRAAFEIKAYLYISQRYPAKNSCVGVFSKDQNIIINICTENINSRNMWAGCWNSLWTINLANANNAIVHGTIKIHAHYFEDVNSQSQTCKQIDSQAIMFTSVDQLVTAVMNLILNCENDLQSGLDDMYVNMNEETFKQMRRTMPITKTKMDWNMNSLRMNRMVMMPGMPAGLPGLGMLKKK
jgi:capping protein alpha